MNINFPKIITNIIQLIKDEGYKAYVVGGFIRDYLLGKESYDVDITTSATPTEIKKIFKEYTLDDRFEKYGSIKFEIEKYHIEITTFRKEYEYLNNRRPNRVEFITELSEDLKRRDFTINAICYDGKDLIDEYNGIDDLNNRVIKMIGDPMIRFEEDALRMLRALRFSSSLGFKIDENICKAINEKCYLIDNLTNSVKKRELDSIEKGKYYKEFLNRYGDIFNRVFDKKTKGGY